MKITEETKIKDLISEGYELSTFDCDIMTVGQGKQRIELNFRKKEVKDFKWYANKYQQSLNDSNKILTRNIYVVDNNYDAVPFEFKIGLLKFICDDIGADWMQFLDIRESKTESLKVTEICPKEFIKSILNENDDNRTI